MRATILFIALAAILPSAQAECRSTISAAELQPLGDHLHTVMGDMVSIAGDYAIPQDADAAATDLTQGSKQLLISLDRAQQQQYAQRAVFDAIAVYRALSNIVTLSVLRDYMSSKKDQTAVTKALELNLRDTAVSASTAREMLIQQSTKYESPILVNEAVSLVKMYDEVVALGDTCDPH